MKPADNLFDKHRGLDGNEKDKKLAACSIGRIHLNQAVRLSGKPGPPHFSVACNKVMGGILNA